jgi:hypothetical protein
MIVRVLRMEVKGWGGRGGGLGFVMEVDGMVGVDVEVLWCCGVVGFPEGGVISIAEVRMVMHCVIWATSAGLKVLVGSLGLVLFLSG